MFRGIVRWAAVLAVGLQVGVLNGLWSGRIRLSACARPQRCIPTAKRRPTEGYRVRGGCTQRHFTTLARLARFLCPLSDRLWQRGAQLVKSNGS